MFLRCAPTKVGFMKKISPSGKLRVQHVFLDIKHGKPKDNWQG